MQVKKGIQKDNLEQTFS